MEKEDLEAMTTESYVYKKEVDWSLFNYGFAIPNEHQVVFKQIADRYIERGESKQVTLYLDGVAYSARLQNNNIDKRFGNRKDIVQVRYSQNSELAEALRKAFQRSYTYIYKMKQLQAKGSKKHIPLPDEYKEYLAIYTTIYDDSYILEPIVCEEMEILKDFVKGKQEREVEADFSYKEKDDSAGIRIKQRLVRLRKLNRLIGENLKLLYGYRCQICGKLIGEEYGAHIAEAHHIDYFVKSLNNDASNQMIVCPNHHSIIHDVNPVFDRNRRMYIYSNGLEQKLTLNKHL